MSRLNRRSFLREFGLSATALPFLSGLPGLQAKEDAAKQRLVIMFSPNGTLPNHYWPDKGGENLTLKPIMEPLEPFKERMLTLKGVHNKIGGDGDRHMRGSPSS